MATTTGLGLVIFPEIYLLHWEPDEHGEA